MRMIQLLLQIHSMGIKSIERVGDNSFKVTETYGAVTLFKLDPALRAGDKFETQHSGSSVWIKKVK